MYRKRLDRLEVPPRGSGRCGWALHRAPREAAEVFSLHGLRLDKHWSRLGSAWQQRDDLKSGAQRKPFVIFRWPDILVIAQCSMESSPMIFFSEDYFRTEVFVEIDYWWRVSGSAQLLAGNSNGQMMAVHPDNADSYWLVVVAPFRRHSSKYRWIMIIATLRLDIIFYNILSIQIYLGEKHLLS